MSKEINVLDPYFVAYHIYSLAFKDKNMMDGLAKALYFIKMCFNANNVILYKQNEDGDYVHQYNSVLMNTNSSIVTAVLNSAKGILDNQKTYELNLNFNDMQNIAFIRINTDDQKYVLAITDDKQFKNIDEIFLNVFIETMSEILSKMEQIESLTKTSEVDTLTRLSNRNTYENDIRKKEITEGMIYAIFDLFRLKNINDNYDHQKGDEYIRKTAEILRKHFPKYVYTIDSTGKKTKSETGSCLYRIGGDEFVLISDTESYESTQIKIMIIQDEIKNMDLGINEPLGINYGLVQAKQDDTFRDLYLKSDALLSENKHEYYLSLGYDRRK